MASTLELFGPHLEPPRLHRAPPGGLKEPHSQAPYRPPQHPAGQSHLHTLRTTTGWDWLDWLVFTSSLPEHRLFPFTSLTESEEEEEEEERERQKNMQKHFEIWSISVVPVQNMSSERCPIADGPEEVLLAAAWRTARRSLTPTEVECLNWSNNSSAYSVSGLYPGFKQQKWPSAVSTCSSQSARAASEETDVSCLYSTVY